MPEPGTPNFEQNPNPSQEEQNDSTPEHESADTEQQPTPESKQKSPESQIEKEEGAVDDVEKETEREAKEVRKEAIQDLGELWELMPHKGKVKKKKAGELIEYVGFKSLDRGPAFKYWLAAAIQQKKLNQLEKDEFIKESLDLVNLGITWEGMMRATDKHFARTTDIVHSPTIDKYRAEIKKSDQEQINQVRAELGLTDKNSQDESEGN